MKGRIPALFSACILLCACTTALQASPTGLKLFGYWITETNGDVMLDPQTSGLKKWRGQLLTVSDGSAHPSQRLKFAKIDSKTAKLSASRLPMQLSKRVRNSCFVDYLSVEPDFEALVVDTDDDSVFYLVTEDASRSGGMSEGCEASYAETGSTEYPTLLVRLALQQDELIMTHVRPLQFDSAFQVGNFPNDGIEGMAMGPDRTLYLALERDQAGQPRVFSLLLDEHFWASDGFAPVADPKLKTPTFESGNHPINGMDYYQAPSGETYLVAAARNDEEIWFINLDNTKNTVIIPVHFMAQIAPPTNKCPEWEVMDNASLEGVAVDGETLWLINDPWKVNYLKNVQCDVNKSHYEKMAPLLFKMEINPRWFDAASS